MSLKKNIVANYASQFYVTLIGFVMVPMYIKYMGEEAYGLVGFFATLQVWFSLLDMGLTPAMSRETARFRGGAMDARNYRRLVRVLESIFFLVALIGASALFAASSYIARDWLQASILPIKEVEVSIKIMAIIIAIRWMCGIYRAAIRGTERQVWLGVYDSIISTLRFVGVLPILIILGATPTVFFGFQLVVAIVEFVGLIFYTYQLLPNIPFEKQVPWDFAPLKPALKFSLGIAFTSSLWVLVTQTDKLILSNLLSLQDYASFTLAVLAASVVRMITGPVSSALHPRMAKLNAEGDEVGVIRIYRSATQLICVIVIPFVLVMAFFSGQVLWVWTGNIEMSQKAASVLTSYVLGNGILAVGGLAYSLQFAKGDLRLHLLETPLFLVIFLPSLIWAIEYYGINGAGYAWLGTMAIFFICWLPIIHTRFFNGQHISWLIHDVGVVLGLSLCVVFVGHAALSTKMVMEEGRITVALMIASVGVLTTAIAVIGSRFGREMLKRQWRSLFN